MFNFFKKFFPVRKGQNQSYGRSASTPVKTAPLEAENPALESDKLAGFTPAQFEIGTGQNIGLQRDHNEDTIFVFQSVLAGGQEEVQFGLYLVADGMGGYEYGEVASSIAARAAAEYILSRIYIPYIAPAGEIPTESLQEVVEASVQYAQTLVKQRAPGGGTTLTAVLVIGEQVTIAHVGDSRAYMLHLDGRIELLTKDHSLVHKLVELGQITEEEALTHPNRNVLYRALGQPEAIEPDVMSMQLSHSSYLILCSDGLWGAVPDTDIAEIVLSAASPSQACKTLVQAANENGGPDNISVIVMRYV